MHSAITLLQNLTSDGVDRGDKVASSHCSVSNVLGLNPELNSLKSLKEPLASSNREGIMEREHLLEVLFTSSEVVLPLLLVELDTSLHISKEGTSLNDSFQKQYKNLLIQK